MTREITQGDRKGKRQEWRTGRELAAALTARFKYDLDAMAMPSNAIVPRFVCPPQEAGGYPADMMPAGCVAVDAFAHRWARLGGMIFVNPPFALLRRVVFKVLEAAEDGAQVHMLAPDNGDTLWYRRLVDAGAVVRRFSGRPKYEPADGLRLDERGQPIKASSPGFPSALYCVGDSEIDGPMVPRFKGALVPTTMLCPKTAEDL